MELWESPSLSSISLAPISSKSLGSRQAISKGSRDLSQRQEKTDRISMESCDSEGYLLGERCNGIMGVPITFFDKYSPDQFEIVWEGSGNTRASAPKEILCELGYIQDKEDRGGCCLINGKRCYDRIFIRYKHPEEK